MTFELEAEEGGKLAPAGKGAPEKEEKEEEVSADVD